MSEWIIAEGASAPVDIDAKAAKPPTICSAEINSADRATESAVSN